MAAARSISIIANPTSGKGRGGRMADEVARRLRERGMEVNIHPTTRDDGAESIARRVSLADNRPLAIVACGGDGTVQEVVNGIAPIRTKLGSHCPALGLAPAGRCNDFARFFGVLRNADDIAAVLMQGRPVPVDLGKVNGRYFCTVATVGVDADISSFVDGMKMPIRGTLAYVYGTLRVLLRYRGRAVRIDGDFGEIDQRVFMASSANTSSYGGSIRIAPQAVPTDGKLDLCLIDDIPVVKSFMLLGRVLTGRHTQLPEVHFLQTCRLHIQSDAPLDLWADGEQIASTPAEITVEPGAIDVIVRSNAANERVRGQWE